MANPSVTQEIPLIERAYTQFMRRLFFGAAGDAKKNLQDSHTYSTRQLIQSISSDTENVNGVISGSFGANTKYARSVEFGGNKNFPYVAAKKWAFEKARLGHISIPEKRLSTFAYFVSKKVQSIGTKPHPYLTPAWEILLNRFNMQMPLIYDDGVK